MATNTETTTDEAKGEEVSPEDVDFGALYGDETEDEASDMEDLHAIEDEDESEDEEEPTQTQKAEEEQTQEEQSEEEEVEDQSQEETEEDSDDSEEEESEVRVVDYIAESQGYDVETEDLDDTTEGIEKLTDRIADKKAEQSLNRVASKDEAIGELLEFVDAGGSVEEFVDTYYNTVDYGEIDLEEANDREKKRVLRDKLEKVDNYSDEEINEIIEDYEDSGLLDKMSKRAKNKLAQEQEQQKENLVEEQKERQKQRQQEIQEYWNDVEETIEESNQFAGLQIPEAEKEPFFKFISEPVDEHGRSKRDIVVQEAPMEVRLAVDYLLYKDFDLSALAERVNATEQAEEVEQKLGALRKDLKDRSSNNSSSDNTEEAKQGDEVDLEGLMT